MLEICTTALRLAVRCLMLVYAVRHCSPDVLLSMIELETHRPRIVRGTLALIGLALLAACSSLPRQPPEPAAVDVRADIERRIPASVADRRGWAGDIQAAFAAQAITPNPENICAVLAVIEQESGYQADPVVADLPQIARREIDRRAAALQIPKLLVDAGVKVKAADRLRVISMPAEKE